MVCRQHDRHDRPRVSARRRSPSRRRGQTQRCFPALIAERLEISISGAPAKERQWFDIWIDADRGADGTRARHRHHGGRDHRAEAPRADAAGLAARGEPPFEATFSPSSRASPRRPAAIRSTIEDFLTRFRGRLQSLASSQDLVTSSNWRGADLGELVLGQVAATARRRATRCELEGERPWLNPNAALHVGLALHELVANSVSYGALSRPEGTVALADSSSAGRCRTGFLAADVAREDRSTGR